MKKHLFVLTFLVLFAFLASSALFAASTKNALGQYWIFGEMKAASEPGVAGPDGREVVLYKTDLRLRATEEVGKALTGQDGWFMINAMEVPGVDSIAKDEKFFIGSWVDKDGYGVPSQEVLISGKGYEHIDLQVQKGGLNWVPAGYPPEISELKFDNEDYSEAKRQALLKRSEKFVVSPIPTIRAKIEKEVSASSVKIFVTDNKTNKTKSLSNIGFGVSKLGEIRPDYYTGMLLAYKVEPTEQLEEGTSTIKIQAANDWGITSYTATVDVVGGETQIVGPTLVYPNPFSYSKHNEITIAYTLNHQADIKIQIYNIAGEQVWSKEFASGQDDGAKGGYNHPTWNVRDVFGENLPNGIFLGFITLKDNSKVLDKFKLTVFD